MMHRPLEHISLPVVLICCSFSIGQNEKQRTSDAFVQHALIGYKNRQENGRGKRFISLATRGAFALNRLLVGAKPVRTSSTNFRKYEKPGNAETAKEDYHSVKPSNSVVMSLRLNAGSEPANVISGIVGDRWIVLRTAGDKWSRGRPVLELIDSKPAKGPHTDRFIYTKVADGSR